MSATRNATTRTNPFTPTEAGEIIATMPLTRGALDERRDTSRWPARCDVWLLDRRNGATMWKIDQMTNRGVTRPAFYGELLVVGDKEGYLHWIDLANGQFVARVKEGGDGFASAPLTVGTTLYVLTNKGTLAAYRAGAAL